MRAFQGGAGKWRISTTGGIHPRWSPTSNELLFENEERILVAPYSVSGGSFRPEKTQPWSPTRHRAVGTQYPYDIHPDGKRLAIRAASDEDRDVVRDKVVLCFGFGDYLKKIAPPKK